MARIILLDLIQSWIIIKDFNAIMARIIPTTEGTSRLQ